MQLTLTCKDCGKTIQVVGEPSASRGHACAKCGSALSLPKNILDTGFFLGGFEIEKHLGCGSMGTVYLARQLSMDRQVAIKVLPEDRCHHEAYKKDFLEEIKMLGKLDHPNIVTALEAGEEDGLVYVAMRYVRGKSLDEIVEQDGSINEEKALQIAMKLSEALRFAWQRHGLLHRDIKPANIMIDQHKEPILLDLGLFKVYGDDEADGPEGNIMGTPFYMSPEQAYAPKEIDCRSDIYSLGCTLFHALTGRVPFDGDDVYDVLAKHKLSPIPSPQMYNVEVSDECCELLAQMMAKNPSKRHSSWTDLIAHVKATLDPRPVTQLGMPAVQALSDEEAEALVNDEPEEDADDDTAPNAGNASAGGKVRAAGRNVAAAAAVGWGRVKEVSLRSRDRIAEVEWKKHVQTCREALGRWSRATRQKTGTCASATKTWVRTKYAAGRKHVASVDWGSLPAKARKRLCEVEWEKLPNKAIANPKHTAAIGTGAVVALILFLWFTIWLFSGPAEKKPLVTITGNEPGQPAHVAPKHLPAALPDIGQSAYTLMFWFKTNKDGVLFTKSGTTWRQGAKAIYVENGCICFDACGTGVWKGRRCAADGDLHHIALLGGAPMKLYLDGQLELNIEKKLLADIEASTMRFGYSPKWFDHDSFTGVIDEIQMHDAILAEGQMNDVGVELAWPDDAPSPLLNWSFGRGKGPAGQFQVVVRGNTSFDEGRYCSGVLLRGDGYAEVCAPE